MNADPLTAKPRRRSSLFSAACLWLGLLSLGCSQAALESFSGDTMGTRYHVTVAPVGLELQTLIDARLAEINRLMSTYDPQSELSRFNAAESTDWFAVSAETAKVVAFALELAEDSGGAYDPTVGPVVNLWGFGPGKRRQSPPTDEQIAAARQSVGWQLIEVRLDPPALKKQQADVFVDLSSIAKGYAVDQITSLLEERYVNASMAEIGGEVVCRGVKPDGTPWRIGVEQPDITTGQLLQAVLKLHNEALATSGDYNNFFEHQGVRYSHTIDPGSGRPVSHETTLVTVRATDCMTADALATTLLVLGSQAGYDWAQQRDIAAMFVSRVEAGYEERTTTAWDQKTTAREQKTIARDQ